MISLELPYPGYKERNPSCCFFSENQSAPWENQSFDSFSAESGGEGRG